MFLSLKHCTVKGLLYGLLLYTIIRTLSKIALPNLNHPMLLKANQIHSTLFNNISNLNKETNNLVKLRDTLLPSSSFY